MQSSMTIVSTVGLVLTVTMMVATEPVDFDHFGGRYLNAITVHADSSTLDAMVHYTLDASVPDVSDPLFPASGLSIAETSIVRVVAIDADGDASPVRSRWYGIGAMAVGGENHLLVLRQDGQVAGWGAGSRGQIGLGDRDDLAAVDRPTRASGVDMSLQHMASSYRHSLAVHRDGRVFGCGTAADGVLGTEDDDYHDAFLPVPGVADIRQVAAGRHHSMALDAAGRVWT